MEVYLPLAIFGIAFLLIILEVFDKSLIALSGGLLVILLQIITPEEAIQAIDFRTILLLLAMMLLVHIASASNIFEWLQLKIAALTMGKPLNLFLLFCLTSFFFSAFLGNVTTVILIIPVTIALIKGLGKDPKAFVIAVIIAANIGGALTLIGDPSNILIGSAFDLSFLDFIKNLWIPISMAIVLVLSIFSLLYWDALRPITRNIADLFIAHLLVKNIEFTFLKRKLEKRFIISVLSILGLTLAGFILHHMLDLPAYIVAFTGAVLLALLSSKHISIQDSLRSVEWSTLLFFAGLFIMVDAIEQSGILLQLSTWIGQSTTDLFILSLIILWSCGIISMLLDNVPFVTIMIPVVAGLQTHLVGVDSTILLWSLSLGACLGGNGTLLGSSANVVAAGLGRQHGVTITFLQYMRIATPLTIGVLGTASIYLFFATH